MTTRRRVTVVSPHFDDVPLSLGQSLRDGALSRCEVRVRVAFGRTNWTTWVHPTPGRAPLIGGWRMAEETLAARRFGYRFTVARWDEALLRWGAMDRQLLDAGADLSAEPLVGEVSAWLELVLEQREMQPDLLLVPAGLGGHVDHRIVAEAAAALCTTSRVPIGFYEDRPYVAHLDKGTVSDQLGQLGLELQPHAVSGPVSRSTQRLVRRCYPSQMDPYFLQAMEHDLATGAVERAWFPVGSAPDWLS